MPRSLNDRLSVLESQHVAQAESAVSALTVRCRALLTTEERQMYAAYLRDPAPPSPALLAIFGRLASDPVAADLAETVMRLAPPPPGRSRRRGVIV